MTTDTHAPSLTARLSERSTGHARSPEARLLQRYLTLLRLTDGAAITAAMSISFLIGTARNSHGSAEVEAVYCLAVGLAWFLVLRLGGARDRRLLGTGTNDYKNVINASLTVFGLIGIGDLVLSARLGRELAAALPAGIALLWFGRWALRTWLARIAWETRYLRRALVVGDRADVEYVLRQIRAGAGALYNVVGAAVTEVGTGHVGGGDAPVPVVCDVNNVAVAARNLAADAVIVASQPRDDGGFVRTLAWSLEGCDADLVLASRLVDVAGPRVHFAPISGLPLIHVEIPRFDGAKHSLKRLVDVVAAATGLIVLSPLFLAVAIAIKLDDGGPVLFRQLRVGKDRSQFRMVKFRSMVTDAEARLAALRAASDDGNGVLFKLKDDPRITRIGRVLRKYSIDELPQLWNVLVGDMSLVGPRPPLPSEVEAYEDHVHRRLYIKPGLTGMWQISGRSDLDWEESVRLDLFYVENWSLTGDLVILWRTVKVLLHPVGAY
ncbi:sugar transferase [Gryllotalpicola ginsengisoli]|uniref:sugar transferase n=1 Tax=Gryllotalpicola ginsengisoli TaxID=444608 RepID=UPI0003B52629|nr:sugar transferase [Gryllotalpicola ginsengisoli]